MDLDVESEHNSNNEMPSRASDQLGLPTKSESLDTIDRFFDAEFDPEKSPSQKPASIAPQTLDLLDRMDRTYRLLDLIYEQGSGGAVEKVIIAQESVGRFANHIQPRSYTSMTKVNFRALDHHTIRPQGVYGSISALADFLENIGCIDAETRTLLVAARDESSGVTRPTLRPGLYIYDAREVEPDLFYVFFWPEDATWDDATTSSASRNRVTFMRYLTKLCDQLICFVSDEHSEKLVWHDEETPMDNINIDIADQDLYDRLYSFEVKQTDEEEETATATDGFMIQHAAIRGHAVPPKGYPTDFPLEALQPQLVVGEVNQALMQVEYIPEAIITVKINWELKREVIEERLSENYSPTIILHDHIDTSSLRTLLELGLGKRCGQLKAEWERDVARNARLREKEKKDALSAQRQRMEVEMKGLEEAMPFWLVEQAVEHYNTISEESLILAILGNQDKTVDSNDVTSAIEKGEYCQRERLEVDEFFARDEALGTTQRAKILTTFRQDLGRLETDHRARYNVLKRQFRTVNGVINENPGLNERQIQNLADLIQAQYGFNDGVANIIRTQPESESQLSRWTPTFVKRFIGRETFTPIISNTLPHMDDITFTREMAAITELQPVYGDFAAEIKSAAIAALKRKLNRISGQVMNTLKDGVRQQIETAINRHFANRQLHDEEGSWQTLRIGMQKSLSSSESTSRRSLLIRSVKRESPSAWSMKKADKFILKGVWKEPNESGFQYTLYQMEVTSDDYQKVTTDSSHICQPVIRNEASSRFILPRPTSLRFMKLVGKDGILVVVEDDVSLKIFFDSMSGVASAIASDRPKKRFFYDKIGRNHMFAVDEKKRLFAVLATHVDAVIIHVYIFEHESRTLNARGGAINATKWFPKGIPEFSAMTFVAGTEELLLVDRTGFGRVFYLTTETFMPSTLQLAVAPTKVASSADGACLFVLDQIQGQPRLRCFHWASFGTTHGIIVPLPSSILRTTPIYVSSIGHRNSTHIMYLDDSNQVCGSLSMRITRKSTEFEFSVSDNQNRRETTRSTVNNSLIDCHSGVWTRFPLHSPIQRETTENARPARQSIVFVSSAPSNRFSPYFVSMTREFERKTRKPTGKLSEINVTAVQWSRQYDTNELSSLDAGDWLVGLFCLIPIHIAITGSNRFIPLKDGVISSTFEQSLLGASVAEISEAISFGWYESIFNSYLAAKPVKVVTSMGEQSVGKSYALNHFVDTSFAGSAMRCTEGAWLSVTVTRGMLYVAIDFEGVHSIERSAQEDTLLVLLNTAISNFVLFRNNFAMSRDIAELFTSFQSCTTILDPTSNPKLFQSKLIIIVKDVISSDAREIKNEFTQKFARIVQQERGSNFITKLHRGQVDIIPWPVIESSQFYGLFEVLKDRFVKRPITHHHAIQFVDVLKTLMAKLKANDWGALDQNLAVQRAEFLNTVLVTALSFGSSDPTLSEPLKNCDTDEPLDEDPPTDIFYVSEAVDPATGLALSPQGCLADLRMGWTERRSRFEMDEGDFLQHYNAYLQTRAEVRIAYVRRWLQDNTLRSGEKTETHSLLRRFEGLAKELKAAVVLCGVSCSLCGLLCLEQKHHGGNHDCKTSHRCSKLCTFAEQHAGEAVPGCDIPAGHSGRHVCDTSRHLCGAPCDLSGRNGCMLSCTKATDHMDDEHMCPARAHACGEPCSLISSDGAPICTRTCVLDSRMDHQRHCCERPLECPKRCQMCSSLCAAGDHFHALDEEAIHLCGQDHVCPRRCGNEGICEIATLPQKIESTFVGKHNTFQYTKYTQEARKLPCIIPIESTRLDHDGPHVHSTEANAFHYCEQRCEHCGYFCILPLGHTQKEHDTSHGSMEQTEWIVDGDDTTALDLEGRKYATGDSGAPMLCSLLCKTMGRHVHIAPCRAEDGEECQEEGVEHIVYPNAREPHDWITHRLFWARSGFKDPYTNTEQKEFILCDRRCSGDEHDPILNPAGVPSLCILPLFHPPAGPEDEPPLGHSSHDGHIYNCKNPAVMRRSFHIFFALDRSGSMRLTDCRPLAHTPASARIVQHADNRFGAALSSIYGFWLAREGIQRPGQAGGHRDAYTVVAFDHEAAVMCSNDVGSKADDLLRMLPNDATEDGGTNFTQALRLLQQELENTWVTERYPVVIFLSDGEAKFDEEAAYDLFRAAVRLGKPLAFHAVAFGEDGGRVYLQRMTAIAHEIYEGAPPDPLIPAGTNPCSFNAALDTVQLANTYLSIADSLGNPRAALKRVSK